jgi:hypothetical protein
MIGLSILALLIFYLLLIGKLARFIANIVGIEKSPMKVGILLVALLLLPFIDEIVGRTQFKYECKKVQGYKVFDFINSAKALRYDDDPPAIEQPHALIPMQKGISRVIDAASGAVVLQYENLYTPGGWIMRAGLNLGNLSSCNQVDVLRVLEGHGFKYGKDGFFERIAGR